MEAFDDQSQPLHTLSHQVRKELGDLLQYQRQERHNVFHLVRHLYPHLDEERRMEKCLTIYGTSAHPGVELVEDFCGEETASLQMLVDVLDSVQHYEALALLRPEEVPQFTQHPEGLVVCEGSIARLHCEVRGTPRPQLQWYRRDTGELCKWGKLRGETSADLEIKCCGRDVGSMYCCRARNRVGFAFSKAATVLVGASVIIEPSSVVCSLGEWVPLLCRVNAELADRVSYQWHRNDLRLDRERSPVLYIKGATESDMGDYVCCVTDDNGKSIVSPTTTVSLVSRPRISEEPRSRCVVLQPGEPLELTVVSADSPVEYLWHCNGVPVQKSLQTNGRLYIEHTSASDTGVYFCVVAGHSGNLKTVSSKIQVDVEYSKVMQESLSTLQGPEIMRHPGDTEVDLGEPLLLHCEAKDVFPEPHFVWYKNGRELTLVEDSPCLRVPSCHICDEGVYHCKVYNVEGSTESNSATVTVNTKLFCRPKIVEHPQSQTASQGDNVTLRCQAKGERLLTYTWYKNNHRLHGSGELELQLRNVCAENAGMYFCEVKDDTWGLYSASSTATLTVSVASPEKIARSVSFPRGEEEQELRDRDHAGITFENLDKKAKLLLEIQEMVDRDNEFKMLLPGRGNISFIASAKLAVIIGNLGYPEDAGLPLYSVAEADVALLGRRLRALGFEVLTFVNLNKQEMEAVFKLTEELSNKLPGLYTFFFFAGHSFDCHNEQYLVPVDMKMDEQCEACEVLRQCVRLKELENSLFNLKARMHVIILDCCRTTLQPDGLQDHTEAAFLKHVTLPGVANLIKFNSRMQSENSATGGTSTFTRKLTELISSDGHRPIYYLLLEMNCGRRETTNFGKPSNADKATACASSLQSCEFESRFTKGLALADPIKSKLAQDLEKCQRFLERGVHSTPKHDFVTVPESASGRRSRFRYKVCFESYTSNCWLVYVRGDKHDHVKLMVDIKAIKSLERHGCTQRKGGEEHRQWILQNERPHEIAHEMNEPDKISCLVIEGVQRLESVDLDRSLGSPPPTSMPCKLSVGQRQAEEMKLKVELDFKVNGACVEEDEYRTAMVPYGDLLWANVTGLPQLMEKFEDCFKEYSKDL